MAKPKGSSTCERHIFNLSQLIQTLWEQDSLDAKVTTALEYIQNEYHYTLLWVGEYDRFNHQLVTRGATRYKDNYWPRQQMTLHPGDLMEQVVVQQRPIVVANLQGETKAGDWGAIATKFDLQGAAIFPLRRKDRCYGVMVLSSDRWGLSPDTVEKSILFTITSTLAEAFHQEDLNFERQQVKQPGKPLLALLEQIETLSGLEARLQLVADETQQFIGAARTYIYWFEPNQRHFWHRLSNQRVQNRRNGQAPKALEPLPVDDVKGFYQALSGGELVVLGEVESSLKASMIGRLTTHLQAQSLLAAPILYQQELIGFLAVEGRSSRIWSDPEKDYLQGAARLIGLSMPTSVVEDTVNQLKANYLLMTGLAKSIHSDHDWQKVLSQCADQLFEHMGTENLIVLLPDLDQGGFEIGYQNHRGSAKPAVHTNWRALHDIDWQLMEQSSEPVCIENLEDDLKLMAWRPRFLEMGARAFMACNVTPGKLPEGIILVTHNTTRRWSKLERDLLQAISQQIGLILHQWQLQRQANQQEQLHETMQWGLRNLQRTFEPAQLEKAATHHISQLLQVSLVALVAWDASQPKATLADVVVRNKNFIVRADRPILVGADAIINWALQTDGVLPLNIEDLPDVTRQWFQGPQGCQILLVALRTAPEHEPRGVIVVADHRDRTWTEQQMNTLAVLVNQLAWCRRHLLLMERLTTQQQQLAELNWYKQHQIDKTQRQLEATMERLNTFTAEGNLATQQRYQQTVQQLQTLSERLTNLSHEERWQLKSVQETMPLVTLLNRLMIRMNALVQEKQLWTKVHCDSNLTLSGDMQKIEFILHELIANACERSPVNGRIDIWCSQLDRKWLDLSITDNGEVDPHIVEALAQSQIQDRLVPSILNQLPGLHFAICQSLMRQMGGEFILQSMEDHRTLSRMLLPLGKMAKNAKITPVFTEPQMLKSSS